VETQEFDCRNIRTSPKERSKTVKKLMLITMLFVLFLGTRCQALSSAQASFFGKHECAAFIGSHRCKIEKGDTLSKDALAVYGDWHLYSTTLMGANPNIVDANKIYAGSWIIIPDAPSNPSTAAAPATSHVQSHAVVASAATPLVDLKQIHSTIAMEPTSEFSAQLPMESIASFPLGSVEQPLPLPAPLPTSMETTAVKPTHITGYKLVMPKSVAAATGIPLGVPLTTHYNLYRSAEAQANDRPIQYVRLKKKSLARQEGNNIVLYVPLTNLPSQPFNLLIAGVNTPIDGKLFVANAQPVYGKLPGPHNGIRVLFSALAMGGSGYTLAAAFGPIAGPSIIGGAFAMRTILRHHANVVVENAEKQYNETLARANTPATLEVGQ
jgi:phage tail protein X